MFARYSEKFVAFYYLFKLIDDDVIKAYKMLAGSETDTFQMDQLKFRSVSHFPYLEKDAMKRIYFFYHHTGL